jgi:5-methyltetrahydrofolate corrinoid/iron sulfur protein methyltransferase
MMYIIGENIHIVSDKVKAALQNRDYKFFQDSALRQAKAGAQAIDLNIGPQKRAGVEVVNWLVDILKDVVSLPFSFDTTNAAAIEAGLQRAGRQCWINSTSADPERMAATMPLAAKYNAKIIALAMEKNLPASAEQRVEIAVGTLVPRAMELGIPMANLYLDPLILTVSGCQEHAPQTLEAIRFFKQSADPAPMTVAGLSNISNSVPPENRPLINRTFLVMLMAAGLDAVIADPLDKTQMDWIRVVEQRDDSTPLYRLLLKLYDRTAASEELEPEDVDLSAPKQKDVYRTVQILRNKVIYAHSYLQM